MKLLYIIKKDRYNQLNNFIKEFNNYFSEIQIFQFEIQNDIIKYYDNFKPDVVLIHYNKFCFNIQTYEHFKNSYNIYWRNDERIPLESWYKFMTSINLFLTSSDNSKEEVKKLGKNAEYLMMGFKPYEVKDIERKYDIVFTGQNSLNIFPLSSIRCSYIFRLMNMYKNFYCFGTDWSFNIKKIHNSVYNESKIGIAINHYDTSRTYSNRMYQIIGYKALCIAYETKELREVFGNNVIYFKTFDELTEKINYYLSHENERLEIVERAYNFILNNHTWEHKANNIIKILKDKNIIS
jgi:hypothetical protein